MCFKENLSSYPFLGLPKCDIKITEPSSLSIFLIVGSTAQIRVSSAIFKSSFKGTLKSTRIKAFFL